MAAAPHVCVERVRWADVDLVGIARYSAFTRLVEFAEQEWLRAAGMPFSALFEAPTVWLPRRHLSIDYFAPAKLDDPLALVTYVPHVGTTSFTFHVDVLDLADGAPRASAAVVLVCVNSADFVKRSLPPELRTAIEPYRMQRDDALVAAAPQRHELTSLAINS